MSPHAGKLHVIRGLGIGLLLAGVGSFGAWAQSVQPKVPGFQPMNPAPPAQVTAPPAPPDAKPVVLEGGIVHTEVERKGRPGFDTFLATYLTLSKECKVGENPRLEVTVQPRNGKVINRPNAINLRNVPGAPRTNCIGVSPYGVGVFYRGERRFRGEDHFTYRMIYPTGDIREVVVKVVIQ